MFKYDFINFFLFPISYIKQQQFNYISLYPCNTNIVFFLLMNIELYLALPENSLNNEIL